MSSRTGKLKLAAFDLDGTLTMERSCWQRIHRFFGTEKNGEEAMREYELGRISYEEFMRRDISAWPENISIEIINNILSDFVLRPEARKTISCLKQRGMKVAVITSGLAYLARKVCERLQIDRFAANDLETDSKGRLTGRGIVVVEPFRKDLTLHNVARQFDISLDETMAVGDTRFDKSLLRAARIGVAFTENGKPDVELLDVSTYIITNLLDLVHIVDQANLQIL